MLVLFQMDLHIVHLSKLETNRSFEMKGFSTLRFETCLRHIIFFNSDSFLNSSEYKELLTSTDLPNVEVFHAESAYQFVLEVICGLRSLIKGETEIFGQFKDFFALNKTEIEQLGLTDVFKQLVVDCKALRRMRIQNWSQNSYGTLTRKLLNNQDGVALLGAGQLAKEIAPWLKHINKKTIILRQQKDLHPQFSGFNVEMTQAVSKTNAITVLILAAPIKNADLMSLLTKWPNLRAVIDWRGDEVLLATSQYSVFHLHDLKSESQKSRNEEATRVKLVSDEIQIKALEFTKKAKHNPWGWDDFCA